MCAFFPLILVDFDKLGLTDNQNPFGAFTSILSKNMGRMMKLGITDYVSALMNGNKRSTRSIPKPQKSIHSYFQGGER